MSSVLVCTGCGRPAGRSVDGRSLCCGAGFTPDAAWRSSPSDPEPAAVGPVPSQVPTVAGLELERQGWGPQPLACSECGMISAHTAWCSAGARPVGQPAPVTLGPSSEWYAARRESLRLAVAGRPAGLPAPTPVGVLAGALGVAGEWAGRSPGVEAGVVLDGIRDRGFDVAPVVDPAFVLGPTSLLVLAGLVESIARSSTVGLPGLAVDLGPGLAGLEAALVEIETTLARYDRGLS